MTIDTDCMTSFNHFATFVHTCIARWGAFLPAPCGNCDALIHFGTQLVEAGTRHQVYRLVRMPAQEPYDAREGDFESYLRSQVKRRGLVPLFPQDVRPGNSCWAPARLAFYRDTGPVEEEVGDVGGLLRELRPECVETRLMFMRAAAPVTVLGMAVAVDSTQEVRVQIRIDTDIWFSYVMGMLEVPGEDGVKPEWFYNDPLAQRHTPRLNAFLNDLRTLTLTLGGRWTQLEVDPAGENYADMWDEHGIQLDRETD